VGARGSRRWVHVGDVGGRTAIWAVLVSSVWANLDSKHACLFHTNQLRISNKKQLNHILNIIKINYVHWPCHMSKLLL
jgi:hypothetical protein